MTVLRSTIALQASRHVRLVGIAHILDRSLSSNMLGEVSVRLPAFDHAFAVSLASECPNGPTRLKQIVLLATFEDVSMSSA